MKCPTVAANWEHFAQVDIHSAAPDEQRHEMKRAFMSGVASGLALAVSARGDADAILAFSAELIEFAATMKARGKYPESPSESAT